MIFEDFRQELHIALNHLYDPDYQPAAIVYLGAGCDPQEGVGGLQAAIAQGIRSLEPGPGAPPDSRPMRAFKVLHQRFVLKLSQEETAERTGMSVRTVQRAQREAIHLLARRLCGFGPGECEAQESLLAQQQATLSTWHSQVQQELAALQKSARYESAAHLAATIQGVLSIACELSEDHEFCLDMAGAARDVHIRCHPSVLRQILLNAIQQMIQVTAAGRITLSAQQHVDRARISIVGRPARAGLSVDVSVSRELLSAVRGTVDFISGDESVGVLIELPVAPAARATVLVVDDNPDMVRTLDIYCTGTRYTVVAPDEGQDIFQAIRAHSADIIVLDVILPNADGWDLLHALQANCTTRSVPVIVCSVVADERLAQTLGAALYLRKPVYREQLISALDQVLSRAAADT
jgi:CheY-like chemotaxis protein